MKLLENDFDKIYDELSKLYEEESNAAMYNSGASDGFKLAWFKYILKHYQEFLDIINHKLTFEEFYLSACIKHPELGTQEKRCKESYAAWVARFNTDNWRPKVQSEWINLNQFSSPIGLKKLNISQEWYNASGLYVIAHMPTRRLYIGKAERKLMDRWRNRGFITRLYQHVINGKAEYVDAAWHELFKGGLTNVSEYECAILEITDNCALAEKNAIGSRSDANKTLGNIFDLNIREGGSGGSIATKNTAEVVARVEDLVKNGLDGKRLTFVEIADIINNEFEFPNSRPYSHKDVSGLSIANNWRPDANKEKSKRKRDAHAIKDISCYDLDGNKIKDFTDTTEAANWILDTGKSRAAVHIVIGNIKHAILRDQKYIKTAFGYYWKKNQENNIE